MPSTDPNKLSELIAKCEASLTSRNFEEAITGCRAVLSIAPDNIRAKELLEEAQSKLEAELFIRENLRKAQEFFQARDFQKCVSECQKIQLLDPENEAAADLMNRAQEKLEAEPFIQNFITSGQSLFDSGLYNEAIAQWEKVRSIDPLYPGLDDLIEKAKRGMGEPVSIGTSESSGVDFSSLEEPTSSFDFGTPISFAEKGAPVEEEGFGFKSEQEKIGQLLREGDAEFEKGQYQKAIEIWSEIFMLDVNHSEALQKIETARSLLTEQRSRVTQTLKSAVEAYEKGNLWQAKELFEQIKSLDPDNTEADRYLALIEQAREEPAGLEDLISRAEMAEKQGQYREAAQYYSQALAVDAENAELADKIKNLNLLARKQEQGKNVLANARAFLAEGKIESARHAVTKVLEKDPSNPEALELMREIKGRAPSIPSAEADRAAAMPGPGVAAKKGGLPVLKIVAVAAIVLVVGGGAIAYFTLFQEKDSNPVSENKTNSKTMKKTTQPAPKKVTAAPAPVKPVVLVTPEMKEKAIRLVQEANFYFNEKHYQEAVQKAEEALSSDPENTEARSIIEGSRKVMEEMRLAEQKLLEDANTYFAYSEYAGAVKLYLKYLENHPEATATIQPQVIKCYYNLGVISLRQWRCDLAHDYFRQVLFIDQKDQLSQEALELARKCQQLGSGDLEVRKAIALMEMRK